VSIVTPLIIICALFIQNTLVSTIGGFALAVYPVVAFCIILRCEPGRRMQVAAFLGVIADVFSLGRFGGYALAYALAVPVINGLNRLFTAETVFGRFTLTLAFLLITRALFIVFADSGATISTMPALMLSSVTDALLNAAFATVLLPIVAALVTQGRKPVSLQSVS
jgi:cell shape-determining protein MreD